MRRLGRLASMLRAGLVRASTPAVAGSARSEFALTWLNEATLVGISVPPPRSNR